MEITTYLTALEREGGALATAAESAGPDAAVPTCPGWQIRDLVRHVGGVQRWATTIVGEGRAEPPVAPLEKLAGGWPADDDLVAWFRRGYTTLVRALSRSDRALRCWSFLPAPSPLAFWARRQAHETGMHRVDAQGAAGSITPFEPEIAADGIDELLLGFGTRRYSFPDGARRLEVHAPDVARRWHMTLGPESVTVHDTTNGWTSDCAVQASASDVFMLLWNRIPYEGLELSGDPAVLDAWRTTVRIRWRE
jgi:uncharacterized protein (TIGR03083 family)